MAPLLFATSVLPPAKEPDCRGAVFRLELLRVRDDDFPDSSQLGDRLSMVVDAEVVVHARIARARHQERRRLLAALVSAGLLPGLEGQPQRIREIAPLAVGLPQRQGPGGGDTP